MNIIILGSPGSGKGTQAELIVKKYKLNYFEAGKFSRELTKKNKEIERIVNSGLLIPEKTMSRYVKNYLEVSFKNLDDILFDGFPRFESQYLFLRNWLGSLGKRIDIALVVEIPEDEALRRLLARRICEKCGEIYNLITNPPKGKTCRCGGKLITRKDDNKETIKKRLGEYKKNIDPLMKVLGKDGILRKINGSNSIQKVAEDISMVINDVKNR